MFSHETFSSLPNCKLSVIVASNDGIGVDEQRSIDLPDRNLISKFSDRCDGSCGGGGGGGGSGGSGGCDDGPMVVRFWRVLMRRNIG